MVKTLFKCCKKWYFYQKPSINRAIAEYETTYDKTPSLNNLKKKSMQSFISQKLHFHVLKNYGAK